MFHETLYPLYFVFILPYLFEIILKKFIKIGDSNKFQYSNLKNEKLLVILVFLAFLIGFFTPIFGTAYTNLISCMSGASTEFIGELQPVNIFENYILLFMITTVISIIGFTKTKIKIIDLLFTLGLIVFSTLAMRNLFFMYLIGIVFYINILKSFLNTYLGQDIIKKLEKSIVFIIVISIFVLALSIYNISEKTNQKYIYDSVYPVEATEWILKNVGYNNSRIWTSFDWGSYLELNGIKVFIDSRSGMYTVQENENCTVLSDWISVTTGKESYIDIFEKYKITHVLVENDELINKYICYDDNYKIIYKDFHFSLYEKIAHKETDPNK